ncbi:MAG: hypothetical protein ACLFPL_05030 [Candidatus Nanoarchaeia archaeon]
MVTFGSDSNQNLTHELQSKVDTHSKALVSVVERQKNLEEKLEINEDKIELVDHNIIKEMKSIHQDIKHLRDEIHDLKEHIEHIHEFESKVKKQFRIVTTKDEVKKLERYIDIWNPMQFATHDQLLEVRDSIIEQLSVKIEEFLEEENEANKKT